MGDRFGRAPAYARIDVMRWQDAWVVSELELIEPGLYLDVDPTPAEAFAELVASLRWERSQPDSLTSAVAPGILCGNAPTSDPGLGRRVRSHSTKADPPAATKRVDILTP